MPVSVRRFTFLLVALAAACFQLYQAQNIPVRCSCVNKLVKFTRLNITDFEILEPRSGCEKTELIFTVASTDNTTERLCIDPVGKMAKAFLKCWDNKNKNETRKHECITRMKRQDK